MPKVSLGSQSTLRHLGGVKAVVVWSVVRSVRSPDWVGRRSVASLEPPASPVVDWRGLNVAILARVVVSAANRDGS